MESGCAYFGHDRLELGHIEPVLRIDSGARITLHWLVGQSGLALQARVTKSTKGGLNPQA